MSAHEGNCVGEPCIFCYPRGRYVFPQDEPNSYFQDKFQRNGGMELRDYYAAQAMIAMIPLAKGETRGHAFKDAAKLCFEMADAMIAARQNSQEGGLHEA